MWRQEDRTFKATKCVQGPPGIHETLYRKQKKETTTTKKYWRVLYCKRQLKSCRFSTLYFTFYRYMDFRDLSFHYSLPLSFLPPLLSSFPPSFLLPFFLPPSLAFPKCLLEFQLLCICRSYINIIRVHLAIFEDHVKISSCELFSAICLINQSQGRAKTGPSPWVGSEAFSQGPGCHFQNSEKQQFKGPLIQSLLLFCFMAFNWDLCETSVKYPQTKTITLYPISWLFTSVRKKESLLLHLLVYLFICEHVWVCSHHGMSMSLGGQLWKSVL